VEVAQGSFLFDFGGGRGIDGMTVGPTSTIVATAGRRILAGILLLQAPKEETSLFLPTRAAGRPEQLLRFFAGADRKKKHLLTSRPGKKKACIA